MAKDDDMPVLLIVLVVMLIGVLGYIILSALNILPFVLVGAGERGVLMNWGAVTPTTFGEGLHGKWPIYQSVAVMDVKTLKVEAQAGAASKDLQDVHTTIVAQYHLDILKVNTIYQTLRNDYDARIIQPSIQEAVKASTAKFNAEELITQRTRIKEDIRTHLAERLRVYDIILEDISITDFKFSESYTKAIEEKQVAQQDALKAENILKRIEIEAQQKIATAEGDKQSAILRAEGEAQRLLLEATAKAEALRLQREQITPELNKYKAIERWDGTMPTYVGSGILPFLELNTNTANQSLN